MKCRIDRDSVYCGGVSKSVWACDTVDKTRFSQGDDRS